VYIYINKYLPVFTLSRWMSYYYMPIFRITKRERIPVTEASDKIIKLQKSLYITRVGK